MASTLPQGSMPPASFFGRVLQWLTVFWRQFVRLARRIRVLSGTPLGHQPPPPERPTPPRTP